MVVLDWVFQQLEAHVMVALVGEMPVVAVVDQVVLLEVPVEALVVQAAGPVVGEHNEEKF
jgi:hypothetical protein